MSGDMSKFAGLLVALVCAAFLSISGVALAAPSFSAHGSAKQVYVTGFEPGAEAALVNSAGKVVAKQKATSLGGLLFRGVKPGSGYRVRATKSGEQSDALTVLSDAAAPPSTDVYNQKLPESGYGYLTTRDGTKLAINVHPPQDVTSATPLGFLPALPSGPTPTLIEYSGYGYANPAGPTNGISILANIMGFTVVDVNMRGTGCSGGAFDFFEPLQNLDGYDVIETVARQPWVAGGKVGMMGISYGGISQLFTAQLRPPSLAAISPLSLIDATPTTLYPGGVLNTGFAVAWAKERIKEAMPAGKDAGQEWASKKIADGDQTCKDNQVLHANAADLMKKIRQNDHYVPKVADPLSPVTFVDKINVPVFMACQWEDEQTGGHCPTLSEHLTGTTKKWVTWTNGTHVDSLDPETYNRWYDFLMLYVAHQAPSTNAARIQATAPLVYQAAMGIDNVTLPPDPIQQEPTYDGALAAFEKQPMIRVLFDNGAGKDPGQPYPGFEKSFASFPVPGTKARSWFFGKGGVLGSRVPKRRAADSFVWSAFARTLTNFTGDTAGGKDGLWTATPPYKWQDPPTGTGLSYVTPPLSANTTVIGAGTVNAWIRSPRKRTDLQVTITEVRPDGKEVFVQGGWLRGDMRKLDRKKSKPLEPVLSLRAKDRQPLPRKRFVKVTIPLYYQGHVYRAGSRIRVLITAPNGDQPVWSFGEETKKQFRVTLAYGKRMPSGLTLPVVPGVDVPTGLPPCPGLRAEPCRDYKSLANKRGRL
jgi:predicted acyl esterase